MNATDSVAVEEHVPSLSNRQEEILSIVPLFFTVISMFCSGTIIYLVVSSGFRTSYRRILFGLSVADILMSLTVCIGPFLSPRDSSDDHYWTIGNDTTCAVVGTLFQLSSSVWLYNAALSYYFLFIIRFNVREAEFARRYEPWMHAVATLYPIITATIGVSLGMFVRGDQRPRCWVNEYPRGCDEEKGECRDKMIAWIFTYSLFCFALISVVTINVILVRHVRGQLSRGRRHSFSAKRQTNRIREVATQAFMYIGAFILAYMWVVFVRFANVAQGDPTKLFPLLLMQDIFLPSVGIFNLCIYLRPRYIKTRKDYPHESRLWAVRRALYGEAIEVSKSSLFLSSDLSLRGAVELRIAQQAMKEMDPEARKDPEGPKSAEMPALDEDSVDLDPHYMDMIEEDDDVRISDSEVVDSELVDNGTKSESA